MAIGTISYAFMHATGGVHLQVLACLSLFHTSGPSERSMLKYGLLYPLTKLARPFKYMCSGHLVRHPKGGLLVLPGGGNVIQFHGQIDAS